MRLPHIPSSAWLVFNKLAQIEALRNLLCTLSLLHPKIRRGLVCTKLTVPLQVCVLAAGGEG